jgi:superfamily II DNA or RNA helicase
MNFKDFPLKISYKSLGEESFSEILNPLLSCTKVYKRSVGYFSSSALNFIGDGLLEMARNGGRIYLATSPQLSNEDIFAIQSGYSDRGIIERKFIDEVRDTLNLISDENAKMLYMLVKEGIVDVKIVIRANGIYHDKLALLEDYDGNVIACVGSNNETGFGYNVNYEKTRVYKSWVDTEGRIDDEMSEFESVWNGTNSELIVYDFMPALERELLERVEYKGTYKKDTSKYKMRQYQIETKEKWNNNGHNGFFVMATGTGKTITALYSIQDFVRQNKIFTIIAVPYKHLASQWAEDVKLFFPEAAVQIIHGEILDGETKIFASYLQAKQQYKSIIVITTIKSFFLTRYINLYDKIDFDKLLIVDEAHNFANRIDEELSQKYPYKLGLSATPVFGSNEEKTKALLDWFGGQVVDLPIEKALGKYLVNYEYHPIFVNATEEDENKFLSATKLMISGMDPTFQIIIDEEKFTKGYRGRLRAISMAEEKHTRITEIFSHIEDKDHTIIYCSDGRLWFEGDKKSNEIQEVRHLEYILKLINNTCQLSSSGGKASKFTATEAVDERMQLIDSFNKGYIEYLVAIRCLDEGINIPSIKSALILSSNDNYREFVQRRGRILRLYNGKTVAHIYDVIVLPSLSNDSFAKIEFRRYYEYSRLALNKEFLLNQLEHYLERYHLTYDDIKFNNDFVYGGELDD